MAAVLASGHLVQGPRVRAVEERVASLLGRAHAVAVSSGTAALHVALLGVGCGPEDEVIVPAFGFPATANAVELTGGRAVFADVDGERFALDVASCLEAIGPRTAGILVVHAFGIPAPLAELRELADARGLWLIEDAACGLGTATKGRWADGRSATCLSLHPRKTITSGEGGLVVTDDAQLAERLRALRNHGIRDGAVAAERFEEVGFNYRMSDVHAAIAEVQLGRLGDVARHRREVAGLYREALRGLSGRVRWPTGYDDDELGFQTLVVELEEGVDREQVVAALAESGIEAGLAGYAIAEQPSYARRLGPRRREYPVARRLFRQALALPVTHGMDGNDVREVVSRLDAALGGAK